MYHFKPKCTIFNPKWMISDQNEPFRIYWNKNMFKSIIFIKKWICFDKKKANFQDKNFIKFLKILPVQRVWLPSLAMLLVWPLTNNSYYRVCKRKKSFGFVWVRRISIHLFAFWQINRKIKTHFWHLVVRTTQQ